MTSWALFWATFWGNFFSTILATAIGIAIVTPLIKFVERVFKIQIPEIGESGISNREDK